MRARVAWLLLLVVAACGGGPAARVEPRPPPPPSPVMTVHFIDVGQGDATLLELPCGAALIDTGGEANDGFDSVAVLGAYLEAFFARRPDLARTLDLLVVTHPHIDHTRGLPMVLERFRVRAVVDDGLVRSTGETQVAALHAWLAAHPEVRHRDVRVDDIPREGLSDETIDPLRCPEIDPRIRVLWGQLGEDPGWGENAWGQRPFANENNHSVALRVDFGRASLLFTGDLEEQALELFLARYRGTPLLDVDVYKVGHHGSRNGTTEALVRAMTPRVAVFSMGSPVRRYDWTAWKYGHPGRKVVELLESGLADRRAATPVRVGRRSMEFETMTLDRAAYGTGWEGTVVLDVTANGRLTVRRGDQSQRRVMLQPSWM